MCVSRLSLHTVFPVVFSYVLPIVDRLLCTEWRLIARESCPIQFCKTRLSELSLVMPREHLKQVAAAGDKWRSIASESLIACVNEGSMIGDLISGCSPNILENNVAKIMSDGVAKIWVIKPLLSLPISSADIDRLKGETMTKVMEIPGTLLQPPTTMIFTIVVVCGVWV